MFTCPLMPLLGSFYFSPPTQSLQKKKKVDTSANTKLFRWASHSTKLSGFLVCLISIIMCNLLRAWSTRSIAGCHAIFVLGCGQRACPQACWQPNFETSPLLQGEESQQFKLCCQFYVFHPCYIIKQVCLIVLK